MSSPEGNYKGMSSPTAKPLTQLIHLPNLGLGTVSIGAYRPLSRPMMFLAKNGSSYSLVCKT